MAAPGASLQIVGEKVNLLVDAIEELRKLGLKEIATELPELVLVGGKPCTSKAPRLPQKETI